MTRPSPPDDEFRHEKPVASMPTSEIELLALAEEVGTLYRPLGLTIAAAESCTGGLLGHLLTEVPGSSAYFLGSAVVYSYQAKEEILGVEHGLLMEQGAVSAAVAQQMARGALSLYHADVAISITGVAGPGGTAEKPMGLVFFHLSAEQSAGRQTNVPGRAQWSGDRRINKLLSARRAMEMLLHYGRSVDSHGS